MVEVPRLAIRPEPSVVGLADVCERILKAVEQEGKARGRRLPRDTPSAQPAQKPRSGTPLPEPADLTHGTGFPRIRVICGNQAAQKLQIVAITHCVWSATEPRAPSRC